MPTDNAFDLRGIREIDLDLNTVFFPDAVEEGVGFLRQPSSVDGKHSHLRINPPGHVQDYHAVRLKTGTQGGARAKASQGPAQDLLGRATFVSTGQLCDFLFIQADILPHGMYLRPLYRWPRQGLPPAPPLLRCWERHKRQRRCR